MTNKSEDCTTFHPPKADVYLENISTDWLVLTILGCISALIITCIYLQEVYLIARYLWRWEHRNQALILQALYPVFAITSAVGLLIPRAEATSDLLASLFLSLALCTHLGVITDYHGGIELMRQKLADSQRIELRSFPVCCLCFCLPKLKISIRNLTFLQLLVYQFALVKPIAFYLLIVLVNNDRDGFLKGPEYATIITTIMTCSALTALWGNIMTFKISLERLKELSIPAKFWCIQLVLLTDNIQRTTEDFVLTYGGITCTEQLDAVASMLRWHSLLITFEMLPLSILSRVVLGKDKPVFQEWMKRGNSTASNLAILDHISPTEIRKNGVYKMKNVESNSSLASYL